MLALSRKTSGSGVPLSCYLPFCLPKMALGVGNLAMCVGKTAFSASRGMAGRQKELEKNECSEIWGMGSSYWVYGTRQAKLGLFPWDYYNHRIIMSQRLEKTSKIIPPRVQTLCRRLDCLASFSPLRSSYDFSGWILICHLPPLTMPSSLPSHPTPRHWVKYFQEEISQQRATDQLLREIPFFPDWGRDKKQCSHPPSKAHLQAQHGGAASHLCSAQILLTGKCLSEDSGCPLHSWLKIHFKTRFIYILITSAITITLPLLRNCSTACRSPVPEPEISENGGLKVYRVWVLWWKREKSHWPPSDVLLSWILPLSRFNSCDTRSRQKGPLQKARAKFCSVP